MLEESQYNNNNMKKKTAPQVLIDILKGCNPIAKMFIFDAIYKHIDRVLENKETTVEAMKDSFIHGQAWVDCAEQLKVSLNENKI